MRVLGYHTNFYGELPDGINAGEQSDRVLVRWDVDGVDSPTRGAFVEPREDDVMIATPVDIEEMRLRDRAESNGWRIRQRDAFVAAQARGARVVGLADDYSYVLRSTQQAGVGS